MSKNELANVMMRASESLVASWTEARHSFKHRGVVGSGGEETIKKFFRDRLPASIGVGQGEILDANGNRSGQLDIILYHASRTPILFSDASKTNMLIPAEGVIAAIEIKTKFDSRSTEETLASAQRVKSMRRDCYYETSGPISTTVQAHGKIYKRLPILYFALALESINADTLNRLLLVAQSTQGADRVVDLWCVPGQWVAVNASFNVDGGGEPKLDKIDSIPAPDTLPLVVKNGEKSLLLFYLLMCRIVLQAEIEPIELQRYLGDFVFHDPTQEV